MSGERKKPKFMSSPDFEKNQAASFAKHRATPQVTSDYYLGLKMAELELSVRRKKLIYLDTNHWINLRHVVLNYRLQKPAYQVMLQLLTKLHQAGRILCPISYFLFTELMKQTDIDTRVKTANLMDQFSDGLCFQFPLEMRESELRHFIMRRIPSVKQGPKAWVYTKVGFLGGHLYPTVEVFDKDTNNLMQKAWTDLMWGIPLSDLIDELAEFGKDRDFWNQYADQTNQEAGAYRAGNHTYEHALQLQKAIFVRIMVAEDLDRVSNDIFNKYPECADPKNLRSEMEYSPHNFPSLQILAGIHAANMLSTMKFEANDMLDFRHTSMAIPYCDAVCCDHPMATRLRDKPCEFGNVYGAKIFGKVEEINQFLQELDRN